MVLTDTEQRILEILTHAGQIGVSTDDIHDALYGDLPEHKQPESRIIPVFICNIRRKISVQGMKIEPIRNFGYRLTETIHEVH